MISIARECQSSHAKWGNCEGLILEKWRAPNHFPKGGVERGPLHWRTLLPQTMGLRYLPICLDWWRCSKLKIVLRWVTSLMTRILFQPVMWELRDLLLREKHVWTGLMRPFKMSIFGRRNYLQDPSNSRDVHFKLTYKIKPFMVFSVIYTICKGPNLDALKVTKCHICWLPLWYYPQHKFFLSEKLYTLWHFT